MSANIEPPSFIIGSACLHKEISEYALTPIAKSQPAREVSINLPCKSSFAAKATACTTKSIFPYTLSHSLNTAATSSSLVTSQFIIIFAPISSASGRTLFSIGSPA